MPLIEAAVLAAEKAGEVAASAGAEMGKKMIENVGKTTLKELSSGLENIHHAGDGVMLKMDEIMHMSPEQLETKLHEVSEKIDNPQSVIEKLTDEEKGQIKKEQGWSDEVIDNIRSIDEYEVYKKAGLTEEKVNGKPCLVRHDIDWNQKDEFGCTNAERAKEGLAPKDKNGKIIELHHIGQHNDSPLAELTFEEHRSKDTKNILHNNSQASEIDRTAFNRERANHWIARSAEGGA